MPASTQGEAFRKLHPIHILHVRCKNTGIFPSSSSSSLKQQQRKSYFSIPKRNMEKFTNAKVWFVRFHAYFLINVCRNKIISQTIPNTITGNECVRKNCTIFIKKVQKFIACLTSSPLFFVSLAKTILSIDHFVWNVLLLKKCIFLCVSWLKRWQMLRHLIFPLIIFETNYFIKFQVSSIARWLIDY